ncbi:hypothetical protein, partial [Klebsiella pneumoniae]|uniref:hypothetical protein n=1 Tax=Klebsiella pneumoniae TaxID=573 RepID=UPI001965441C
SLWDALRMNMMISYQELVRTFPNGCPATGRATKSIRTPVGSQRESLNGSPGVTKIFPASVH